MTIARADIFSYDLPLVRPLQLRGQTLISRSGFLIRLVSDSEHIGWGEAAPLPGFSVESAEDVVAELKELKRLLPGSKLPPNLSDLTGQFHSWPSSHRWTNSVNCALEMAALNLIANEQAISLSRLLSEQPLETVYINGLIVDTEGVAEATRVLKRDGYRAVKLKVGSNSIDVDIERTQDAFHELGNTTTLRLDANRAWSFEDAYRFAAGITDCEIEYIEEPLADPKLLRKFSKRTGLAIALDESIGDLTPDTLTESDHVGAVILKPTLLGGFERTAIWARKAQKCGIKAVISSCFESSIGIAALAQLTATFNTLNTPVGLDTPSWLKHDLLLEPIDRAHGRMRIVQIAQVASQVNEYILKEIS
ncbi:MAG: o-succinylbenzoate synthase [candidate division Zixibacteria bacterium]|nr:o-succinylbenzoate synthase [candidate division Zixibacteria bacterium]